MQHSNKPFDELKLAHEAIVRMKDASDLHQMELAWKSFLHHLDRIWNKAEAHFSRSPKWGGWSGQYHKARKEDPLLRYLFQARNADEHSISEITERAPSSTMINPITPGGPLRIRSLITGARGEIVHLDIDTPYKIEFVPGRVSLLPIENRGQTYAVPLAHMGSPIDPGNVVAVAELAIRFYSGFLDAAEAFFVKTQPTPATAAIRPSGIAGR